MNMKELIRKLDIASRILHGQKKKYLAEYLECNKRSLEQIDAGKAYVLCTYYFPSEIAAMYDVEFIYIERIVGIAVSCGFIKGKRNNVLPETICSYHKALWELMETGVLPRPSMIIALSYPCTDARILCEKLHELFHIPIFRMGTGKKEELHACCNKLKQHFLLRQSVEETVSLTNQAMKLKKEIDKKRLEYPGIVSSDDILKIFTIENMIGSQQAVRVLQYLLEYIEDKEKIYSKEKKTFYFWMGLIPLYDNSMLSNLEKKYDCRFVYEEMWMFDNDYLQISSFYDELENKIKNSLFYNLDKRIRQLINKVKEFQVGTVINFSQAHCSFLPPQIKEIKQAMQKNDIQMYNLGADVVSGQFSRKKIEEIIEHGKEREYL